MEHLVSDIAVCIIAAWVVAVVSQVARQPLLLAYLVAGFAIGPNGFEWVTDPDSIATISSLGLSLLLFMIGLEIDLKKMASAGRVITVTALCQILGCLALGWLFFGIFGPGETGLEAFYLALAAAMSSTVIIVKILSDKHELETLAGRITLGVLVLQDIATILFLAVQPDLNNPAIGVMALALGKVLLLMLVAYVVSRFVLPPLFKFVARLPELMLVGALAWCFALAWFANYLALSQEMGALIAGVMLSTFPYALDVVARVTSIRDFFVTLFFVSLGMTIPVPTWHYMAWTLVFCLFIIVSRLLTVFTPLYLMKQGYRMSLLPAVNLGQMSELSLVVLALGKATGDVSDTSIGIAAFVFSVLAVSTTYTILKNDFILNKTVPWLNRIRLHDLVNIPVDSQSTERAKRICLLGFSWTASSLLEQISYEKPALLKDIQVVDFNPQVYELLRRRGVHVVYGDITSRNVLHHAGVAHAEIIICSLPNTILKGANNLKLLRQLRELNSKAQIVVHAEHLQDVSALYDAGASYVSAPRLLEAADLLRAIEAAEKNLLGEKRLEQTEQLQERNEVIP